MKYRFTAAGLMAAALVSSHSAPSQAAVEHMRYRGEIANLFLVRDDTVTCLDGRLADVQTSVSIEAFADGAHGSLGDADAQTVMIFFSQFDGCVGASRQAVLFDAPAQYTQQQVQSASIAGSFELTDEFTGEPIGILAVDVELTGVGQTIHSHSQSVSHTGDVVIESNSVGMSRQAEPSGSVSIEGEELINADAFAALSVDHSGEITVTH